MSEAHPSINVNHSLVPLGDNLGLCMTKEDLISLVRQQDRKNYQEISYQVFFHGAGKAIEVGNDFTFVVHDGMCFELKPSEVL